MKLPQSFLFPNYSLLIVTGLMVFTAAILNMLIVPDSETLFQAYFMWEFSLVFFGALAVVMAYDFFKPAERRDVRKLYYSMAAFFMMYVMLTLFSTMKSVIHYVQPYNIDAWLVKIEQIVHLGFLPTTLIDHTIHWGGFYQFLDVFYVLWFLGIYLYVTLIILGDSFAHLRERYLFCFAGVWFVIGNIVACLMASVGPIYVEDYFKTNPSDAMAAVRASADIFEVESEKTKLMAVFFKNLIMEFASNRTVVDPNGISAMPSVHVAIAALMMFHAKHVNRALFVASILFFACIFAGSVLLAWHYAIDGYVAVLLTYGLWKLSAFLPPPQKPQETAI